MNNIFDSEFSNVTYISKDNVVLLTWKNMEKSSCQKCIFIMSEIPTIEEISVNLAENGTLVQGFTPHPAPHQEDGAAEVLDKFGFTWYLST